MFKWLLPREADFFGFFEKHISLQIEASKQLLELVSDGPKTSDKAQRIKDLEHEADNLSHQCIEELHKTFITPFQRDDLFYLMSTMDDIIDLVEDAGQRIIIYKLKEMNVNAKELVEVLLKSVEELQKIFKNLRNLKNITKIKDSFIEINQLEKKGDDIYLKGIANLFDAYENQVLLLIKWKEIFENLENAIDRCKNVANIIEGVILEST